MNIKSFESDLDDFEGNYKERVQFSNIFATVIASSSVAFFIYSLINFPALAVYPFGMFFISILTFLLNRLGMFNYSRMLLAVMVPLLFFLFHAFIVPPKGELVGSMFFFQIALSFLPWVVFDQRESLFLGFVVVVCTVLLICQSKANEFLESGLLHPFSLVYLHIISYVSGFAIFVAIFAMLVRRSSKFEQEVAFLNQELEGEKLKLETQQEKVLMALDEVQTIREKMYEKEKTYLTRIAHLEELVAQEKARLGGFKNYQ